MVSVMFCVVGFVLYCGHSYAHAFFFFNRAGPHPALHSFPTRRSSDLDRAGGRARARHRDRARPGALSRARGGDELDRKSTRLNSSHQIITYAVFCLKKKTTQSLYSSPATESWPTALQSRATLTTRTTP